MSWRRLSLGVSFRSVTYRYQENLLSAYLMPPAKSHVWAHAKARCHFSAHASDMYLHNHTDKWVAGTVPRMFVKRVSGSSIFQVWGGDNELFIFSEADRECLSVPWNVTFVMVSPWIIIRSSDIFVKRWQAYKYVGCYTCMCHNEIIISTVNASSVRGVFLLRLEWGHTVLITNALCSRDSKCIHYRDKMTLFYFFTFTLLFCTYASSIITENRCDRRGQDLKLLYSAH